MSLFVFRIDNSENTLNNFHISSFRRSLCQFQQNLAQIMLFFFVYFVSPENLSLTPTYPLPAEASCYVRLTNKNIG